MKLTCFSLAALAVLLLAAPASVAATITVSTLDDELNSDGDCSLREAIQAANTNAAVDACTAGESGADAIEFAASLINGTVTLGQAGMTISEDVAIDGNATIAGTITISGGDTYQIFQVTGGTLTLADLTLSGAVAEAGAAVYVASGASLVATDVVFAENEATGADATDGGAAVYNDGGTIRLTDCTLRDNDATGTSGSGGAILNNAGDLTVTTSAFTGNAAQRAGGAIEAAGESMTTLTGTDFTDNEAGSNPGNGGAFHISGTGSATITGGTVSGNVASREGGGFWNNSGTMTVSGTTFTGNEAQGDAGDDGGGALFNNGGTMVVEDVTASGNSATGTSGSGGGLMTVGGTLTVTGGTLSGNTANRAGAGVESAGAMTMLVDVTVDDNDIPAATAMPGNGGGVHAGGGTLTVRGGTYSDNDATEGGGLWTSGTLVIEMSDDGATMLTGNTGRGDDASNGGGGVYVETGGSATITGAMITGNMATGASGSGGGLLVAPDASASVTGTTFMSNEANRAGAGIEVAGGTLMLTGSTVSQNVIPEATAMPGNGGGLHAGGGSVTVSGGTFSENEATEGGGLWSNGTLVIQPDDSMTGTSIMANVGRGDDASNGGGGVYAESGAMITITGAAFTGNMATGTSGSGGGLLVADGSTVTVMGGSISDNEANRAGAGIEVADDPATEAATALTLTQVTVDGNAIDTPMPGNGGGLHIGGAGTVDVVQSTFSGNTAREGAGLWAAGASTLDLTNSTVSGNAATEDGGGVYDNGGASTAMISLESTTVALNTAGGNGGGLLSKSTDGASFTVANSALAGNMATASGADCFGMFTSGDYNLVQMTADCTFTGPTGNNVTGADPMFGALADNGGPTFTHAPMMGSPVIDAGMSASDVDQRDFARTDGADDIGAVERGAEAVSNEGGPDASNRVALLPARPNPTSGRTTLAFTVPEAAAIRVELYNVLGQRVQTVFDGMSTGGEQTVAFDASRLAAGVYVVRVESAGEQATQRLTVVR